MAVCPALANSATLAEIVHYLYLFGVSLRLLEINYHTILRKIILFMLSKKCPDCGVKTCVHQLYVKFETEFGFNGEIKS